MKLYLGKEEWYPVFERADPKYARSLTPKYYREVEVTQEENDYFTKVFADFRKVQDRLEELYKKAPK